MKLTGPLPALHGKNPRGTVKEVDRMEDKPSVEESKGVAFKDRPIQLVKINHDIGKFQICDAGLKILQQIEGNVGIVAFTGLYRTGKSFTFNLLLDKLGKGVTLLVTFYSLTLTPQ